MTSNGARQKRPGKDGVPIRRNWPRLTLQGRSPQSPTYAPIPADHRLYALAAWGYHHASELDHSTRIGFYDAMARAWPRPRGRAKSRYQRGLFITALANAGIPIEQIADQWCITPGEATDLVRDWRSATNTRLEPAIETEDDGVPYDPASLEGSTLAGVHTGFGEDNYRRAEELASEHGYRSFVDLLGARLNPLG